MSDAEFRSVVEGLSARRPSMSNAVRPITAVAVLGAGPVGLAIACEAIAEGRDTRLWSPFANETTRETITVRGVHLVGTYRMGASQPAPAITVASGVDTAVAGADLIVVAVPALSMASLATFLAPHLDDGQIVLLVGGRRLGTAEMRRELARSGATADVVVAELTAPPHTVSAAATGLVMHARLAAVGVGVSPSSATTDVVARLAELFPSVVGHESVLHSGFAELTGVVNVAPLLLNVGAAVADGATWAPLMTPTVADVIETLDRERRAVAFAFGVRDLPTAAAQLAAAYGLASPPAAFHDAWHAIAAFDDLPVPPFGLRRLLADDIACSLVPLASAGLVAGVPTPVADSLISIGGHVVGQDLVSLGRSIASLGLAGQPVEALRARLRGEGW